MKYWGVGVMTIGQADSHGLIAQRGIAIAATLITEWVQSSFGKQTSHSET